MHGLSDAVSREIAVYGYIIIKNYTINLCFHNYRSVHHPNMLSLLGVIIQETRLLIITNLVNGKNLHKLIFDSSRVSYYIHSMKFCLQFSIVTLNCVQMSLLTKVQIAFQVAQALRYMHTATPPTIHLDVKPANVLVRLNLSTKLVLNHHILYTG